MSLIDNAALEVVSPYAKTDLGELKHFQSGNSVYLLHPDYYPRKIERRGHRSWSIVEAFFKDGPYLSVNGGFDLSVKQRITNPFFENGMDGWMEASTGDGFVEHKDATSLVEFDPGTSGGSGDATLQTNFVSIVDVKHIVQILIHGSGPVDLKIGTSAADGTYFDQEINPGWNLFELTTSSSAFHIELGYQEYAKSNSAIGACLVYDESARLIQPNGTTGEVTLTAIGFTPFASTDVGRLIRLTYPGHEPGYAVITAFTSTSVVTAQVMREFGSTTPTEDWQFWCVGWRSGLSSNYGVL